MGHNPDQLIKVYKQRLKENPDYIPVFAMDPERPPKAIFVKFCYDCGQQLESPDVFCSNCGMEQLEEKSIWDRPPQDFTSDIMKPIKKQRVNPNDIPDLGMTGEIKG